VRELIKIYDKAAIKFGVWFIPIVNPDGVKIAKTARPLWKANARGVDLNVNFDADWGTGAQNVRVAGAENYIGECPESEPETRALVNFTKKVNPAATVAYHSKGEIIYHRPAGENLARRIAAATGYVAVATKNSAGGYTDWVSKLGIPSVTIEVGRDEYTHPIGREKLPEILAQNRFVPLVLFDTLTNRP
jgi:predicted deacylase